jgi:hypothetical protein
MLLAPMMTLAVSVPAQAGPIARGGWGNEPGGMSQSAICGPHAVVTAVWTVVDAESMKQIEIFCTPLNPAGVPTGPQSGYPGGAIIIGQGLNYNQAIPYLHKMQCRPGEMVGGFTAGKIRVVNNGLYEQLPWNSYPGCHPPGSSNIDILYYPPQSSGGRLVEVIPYNAADPTNTCLPSEAAVGLWGRADPTHILTFGVLCQSIGELTPPSFCAQHPGACIKQVLEPPPTQH